MIVCMIVCMIMIVLVRIMNHLFYEKVSSKPARHVDGTGNGLSSFVQIERRPPSYFVLRVDNMVGVGHRVARDEGNVVI